MEQKQTAVEWLVDELLNGKLLMPSLIEQAKEMEKQQIEKGYGVGHNDGCAYMTDGKTEYTTSEQYYNEEYGK